MELVTLPMPEAHMPSLEDGVQATSVAQMQASLSAVTAVHNLLLPRCAVHVSRRAPGFINT